MFKLALLFTVGAAFTRPLAIRRGTTRRVAPATVCVVRVENMFIAIAHFFRQAATFSLADVPCLVLADADVLVTTGDLGAWAASLTTQDYTAIGILSAKAAHNTFQKLFQRVL